MFKKIKSLFTRKCVAEFNDSDLWNLDLTIAKFVLPRLQEFKKNNTGYPGYLTEIEWEEMLDKMIYAMQGIVDEFSAENILACDAHFDKPEEHWVKVRDGLCLFGEHFMELWD